MLIFQEGYSIKVKSKNFCGICAQHKHAQAERAIQKIMHMARTFMIHVLLHRDKRGVDGILLWSFAVNHAVWFYNRMKNRLYGLTPMELMTQTRTDYKYILCFHVWGCPVFVMDCKLK